MAGAQGASQQSVISKYTRPLGYDRQQKDDPRRKSGLAGWGGGQLPGGLPGLPGFPKKN